MSIDQPLFSFCLNFEGQPLIETLVNLLFLNTKTRNSDLLKTSCILSDPVVLVVVAAFCLIQKEDSQ